MTFAPDSAHVSAVCSAKNTEERRCEAKPSLLILHYTGMASAAKAIDWLAREESGVSCHYVIDTDGTITQLVPECERAWHAGVSFWRGETDVNSRSIGIEIQNPGHEHGYPDFPVPQLDAVIALAKDIVQRHGIAPDGVLAHSDVAPGRKIDPGEKFDWAYLAKAGVGFWVRPVDICDEDVGLGPGDQDARVERAQRLLAEYGYNVPINGEVDEQTTKVLQAFQLHFRPARVDGRLDHSTELTLERLIKRVRGQVAA